LEGFEAHHAEIRRDERDEYVYINLGGGPSVLILGGPVTTPQHTSHLRPAAKRSYSSPSA
jgi:hypothetical protein